MSILNVAYSGLSAFQRALSVTGNNISNAATQGYSRQSIQFTPSLTQKFGGSYLGSGVNVSSIYRNVDQFARYQVRSSTSVKSQYESYYQQASQIDKLLSQQGTSLSTSMNSFFDAMSQLNNSPETISARNVALKQSQLLVDQFKSLQSRLDEYQNNSTFQINESVMQINQITSDIASVNNQLMSTPNALDLLDKRDELLNQLSQFVEVSAIDQGDGTITVAIADGEMLVAGADQRKLSVSADKSYTLGSKVLLGTGAGEIDISKKLTTGKLGGLLHYEQDVIGKTSQLIGQMAIGLAQKFNAQHQLGMDLNNQLGKQFFTDYNTQEQQLNRVTELPANTGTGVLSVAISDISQTKLADYELIVSDTLTNQVRLLNKNDGTSTTLNWSSTPPAPPAGQLVIDGMTITVDNISNLANNDRFSIMPTRGAARDLALQITDYREIALASPVRTNSALSNNGTGQIALGSVIDPTSDISKEYRIDFTSATQYNLVNVTDGITTGPITFTPNTNNTLNIPNNTTPAYSVVLSGIPKAGDQFTASFNTGGGGDNRNGLMLTSLQQTKIFSGGSENLFDRYSNLLSQIGSQTNQAKIRFDSAKVLHDQAIDFQESKSGVNLDEEGANLIRYQHAYEAAGKLMAVSNQIMDVLFDMMR